MRSLALVVMLAAVLLIGCGEMKRSHYATSADALADGAIARGWLPEVFDANVSEIHESHDLDSNHGFADFHYRPELISQLKKQCTPARAENVHLGYQCGIFTISLDPARLSGHLSH